MAGSGTGYPLSLRCAKCRRRGSAHGLGMRLRRYAVTKPLNKAQRGHGNARALQHQVKIKCLDCGHVGWTRHRSAAKLGVIS